MLHELHKICPKYFISEYIETVNGSLFCENESVKYLGIQFDSRLKFKKQTAIVTCKVSRMINSFWKMPNIGLEIKKTIYQSLVESHLNYDNNIVKVFVYDVLT